MTKRKSDPLRKLARSTTYQNLYTMAKELSCVQLFKNTREFSKIQLEFLYWLVTYDRLYSELASRDNKYLTKEIIENDFYCDCYLIWERKKKPKLEDKEENNEVKNGRKIDRTSDVPSMVFKRGKK